MPEDKKPMSKRMSYAEMEEHLKRTLVSVPHRVFKLREIFNPNLSRIGQLKGGGTL